MLGLGADLLPVVPDANAEPGPDSKVKKFGKIPSTYDRQGYANGIKGWQSRAITPDDVARWSEDDRLSMCVRASAVRAIDIDIEDAELSARAQAIIEGLDDGLPKRVRANSAKCLYAFRLAGEHKKRIIKCANNQRIEMLADGQQFVVAGQHPSGARYEWVGGLPSEIPEIGEAALNLIWNTLLNEFGEVRAAHMRATPYMAPILDGLASPAVDANVDNASHEILTTFDHDTAWELGQAITHPELVAAAADNSTWSEVGYALLSLGAAGREMFINFSQSAPNYTVGAPEQWWDTHADQTPRTDFRHVFTMARALGWKKSVAASLDSFPIANDEQATETPATMAPDILIPDQPAKPIIRLMAGELHLVAERAEEILSPQIYTQTNTLVRICGQHELKDDGVTRDPGQLAITRVTSEYVQRELTRIATIQSWNVKEKQWINIDCPRKLSENILGQRDWPTLRRLDAIARAPFIRSDGSICATEGYDEVSGVFYTASGQYDGVSERPAMDDALSGLRRLLGPFDQFPFANAASQSAFVAHILTEAARLALTNVPMFWYTAPTPGTGKTLLSRAAGHIVHGTAPALQPWSTDSEEMRKTLFSGLLAGDRSITFDNLPNGLKVRSTVLCGFLTAGSTYKDRRLGASEILSVRHRATLAASGNNITPTGDLARRSVIIRLDANDAELRKRTFRINDLHAHIEAVRGALLPAALTIIRAYMLSGAGGPVAVPSFEQWSRFVRNPIIWLGFADPMETQVDEADDEQTELAHAFELLRMHEPMHSGKFMARDVAAACQSISDKDNELAQALSHTGCSNPLDVNKVGYWLREQRDKIAGNYKLLFIKSTNDRHPNSWMLRHIGGNEDLL